MRDTELRLVIPGRGGQNPAPLVNCHNRSLSFPTSSNSSRTTRCLRQDTYDGSPLSAEEQQLWFNYTKDGSHRLVTSTSSPCLTSTKRSASTIPPCPSLSSSPISTYSHPSFNASPRSTFYSPQSPFQPSTFRFATSNLNSPSSLYSPYTPSPLAGNDSSYFLNRINNYELEAEAVPLTSGNYLDNKPLPPEPSAKGWKRFKKKSAKSSFKDTKELPCAKRERKDKAFSFHFGKAHLIFGPDKEELAELRKNGKEKLQMEKAVEKKWYDDEVWCD